MHSMLDRCAHVRFSAVELLCWYATHAHTSQTLTSECAAALQIGALLPDMPAAAVRLLNSSGERLTLRQSLRVPFAAWLAQTAASAHASAHGLSSRKGAALGPVGADGMRRYEVAKVGFPNTLPV